MNRRKPFVMPVLADEKDPGREAEAKMLVESIYRQLGHDPAHPPALITEAEAAAVLHQTPSTLQKWRWARSRPIKHRKVGGTVLYLPHDVADFIISSAKGTS